MNSSIRFLRLRSCSCSLSLVLLLLCTALAPLTPLQVQAQSSSGGKHWYTFVITNGGSTSTFTGSSTIAEADMATAVASGTQAISLDDLRLFGAQPGSTDPNSKWYAAPTRDRLFILPRNVVYFFSLSGDPLGLAAGSNPVTIVK